MTILDEIIASLGAGERVMLATIVAATGSTPVGASSRLLVREGGASTIGTIGGGCTEGEVVLRARRMFDAGVAEILTLRLDGETDQALICGGTIDVLLEPLVPDERALFEDLRTLAERGEDSVLATLLGPDGRVRGRAVTSPIPIQARVRSSRPEELPFLSGPIAGIAKAVAGTLREGEPARMTCADGVLVLEPWVAPPRLIVFGGGHVGRAVARAAGVAGFRVTVADDRAKYANPERFPEAAETLVVDFTDAAAAAGVGPGAYVVIVTRGHAFDETVLGQVLDSGARYIGMIGSRKKVLAAMRNLHARGATLDALRLVHAPIGLEIGAVTAEEIAVSIVAQLIRVRRGAPSPAYDKSDGLRPLVEELEPRPLIATRP